DRRGPAGCLEGGVSRTRTGELFDSSLSECQTSTPPVHSDKDMKHGYSNEQKARVVGRLDASSLNGRAPAESARVLALSPRGRGRGQGAGGWRTSRRQVHP